MGKDGDLLRSGGSMGHLWGAISIAALIVAGQAAADDQARTVETAKEKAEVLEKKVADKGVKAHPSPEATIKKSEAQAVDPAGKGALNDPITCLSRTIYWEARGDGAVGMEAIANVVMNRLGQRGFPGDVCSVVKQGHEHGACQFSWWCDHRSDDAKEVNSYALAKEIARKALNRQLPDRTGGALYFQRLKAKSRWSKEYVRTAKIGKTVFYKPPVATAK